MALILEQKERERILSSLIQPVQKNFIMEFVKRGKRTIFANEMTKKKGMILPDNASSEEIEILLDEWILQDYIDNGYVNPDTPCECGRPLRYQYIVKHKSTNVTRRFGINHFEEHTGLPVEIVSDIKKGFGQIDYEMDDILQKIKDGWELYHSIDNIPSNFNVPFDIENHLNHNVPLTEVQIRRLKTLINQFLFKQEFDVAVNKKNEISMQSALIEGDDQVEFDLFSENVMEESLSKLNTGTSLGEIELNNLSERIPESVQMVVDHLLDTISSLRVICEVLIKDYQISSKRYLTGKPMIYVPLSMYLDQKVKKGEYTYTGEDYNDRHYYKKR